MEECDVCNFLSDTFVRMTLWGPPMIFFQIIAAWCCSMKEIVGHVGVFSVRKWGVCIKYLVQIFDIFITLLAIARTRLTHKLMGGYL